MRKAGLLAFLASLALLVLAAAPAYADDPHGFNGTVKIHAEPGESEPIMANEPHVCAFHIHGFNFDGSSTGWWTITAWPPTGDGSTVVSHGNWGPASASGEWKSAAMTLPDGHYKLSWDQTTPAAPGGEKHKVFWVECNGSTSGGNTGGETGGSTGGTTGGTTGGSTGGTTGGNTGETAGGNTGETAGGNTGETTGGSTGGTTGGNTSGATGGTSAGAGTTTGGTAGSGAAANEAGPTTGGTAAGAPAGVVNLPSTSTARDDSGLIALGIALMAIGAVLLRRRTAAAR